MAESDDNDSTLGSDSASQSKSLPPEAQDFPEENGRTYHGYKAGKYPWPNDEQERNRLDLQHHLFKLTFNGKLFICPLNQKKVQRVLELGTGTGIWTMDFADEHPQAYLTGVDLSPIQPIWVPPNVHFIVDDLEDPWIFSTKFDLIYIRMMTGSFSNWPQIFEECMRYLQRGGHVEIADICFPVQSYSNTLPKDSALREWSNLMLKAANKAGRPIDSAKSYKLQLENAGFTNVEEVVYTWPQNHKWPNTKQSKELGQWNLVNNLEGLHGFSMAPFTRTLGWTKEEVEVLLARVRNEMKDRRIQAYWQIYVVYGQKSE